MRLASLWIDTPPPRPKPPPARRRVVVVLRLSSAAVDPAHLRLVGPRIAAELRRKGA